MLVRVAYGDSVCEVIPLREAERFEVVGKGWLCKDALNATEAAGAETHLYGGKHNVLAEKADVDTCIVALWCRHEDYGWGVAEDILEVRIAEHIVGFACALYGCDIGL